MNEVLDTHCDFINSFRHVSKSDPISRLNKIKIINIEFVKIILTPSSIYPIRNLKDLY